MNMKILPDHFEYMQTKISAYLSERPDMIEDYHNGNFPRADRCKDLNMRFRWDVCYFAVGSKWICDNLYSYMDDNHIDTSLRRIVPAL